MKRTLIFGLLGLLLVAGAAAWKFMPRVLAYDECSPVYRHFADMQLEGVRVTYIKDKQVNDTLRLPVTLLEAESDRGWELLDSLFGYTENQMKLLNDPDLPDNVKKTLLDNWPSFECHRAHRETPEQVVEPHSGRPDDVTVYLFPYLRSVSIFEVKNGDTFNAELDAAEDELNKEEIRCPHEAVQLSVMRKVDSAIDNNVKTQ